jgi:hypothetical protein
MGLPMGDGTKQEAPLEGPSNYVTAGRQTVLILSISLWRANGEAWFGAAETAGSPSMGRKAMD